jgi:hypothetical protein
MEGVLSFIKPELFIIVIFLYCVGLFLKLCKSFNSNWMIPYILLGISFLITLAYVSFIMNEGFSPSVIVAVIIQSVLIAAVTVFGNELIQQVLKKNG